MAIFNSYVKLPEGNKIEKKGVDEKNYQFQWDDHLTLW